MLDRALWGEIEDIPHLWRSSIEDRSRDQADEFTALEPRGRVGTHLLDRSKDVLWAHSIGVDEVHTHLKARADSKGESANRFGSHVSCDTSDCIPVTRIAHPDVVRDEDRADSDAHRPS